MKGVLRAPKSEYTSYKQVFVDYTVSKSELPHESVVVQELDHRDSTVLQESRDYQSVTNIVVQNNNQDVAHSTERITDRMERYDDTSIKFPDINDKT